MKLPPSVMSAASMLVHGLKRVRAGASAILSEQESLSYGALSSAPSAVRRGLQRREFVPMIGAC